MVRPLGVYQRSNFYSFRCFPFLYIDFFAEASFCDDQNYLDQSPGDQREERMKYLRKLRTRLMFSDLLDE